MSQKFCCVVRSCRGERVADLRLECRTTWYDCVENPLWLAPMYRVSCLSWIIPVEQCLSLFTQGERRRFLGLEILGFHPHILSWFTWEVTKVGSRWRGSALLFDCRTGRHPRLVARPILLCSTANVVFLRAELKDD